MAPRVVRTKEQFIEALNGNLRAKFRLPVTTEHIALATAGDAGHCPIVLAAAQKLKKDTGLTLMYAKLDMYKGDSNTIDRTNGQPQLRFRIKEFPSVRYAIPLPEVNKPWVKGLDRTFKADAVTIDFDLSTTRRLPERNTLSTDRYARPHTSRPVRQPGKILEREWE